MGSTDSRGKRCRIGMQRNKEVGRGRKEMLLVWSPYAGSQLDSAPEIPHCSLRVDLVKNLGLTFSAPRAKYGRVKSKKWRIRVANKKSCSTPLLEPQAEV